MTADQMLQALNYHTPDVIGLTGPHTRLGRGTCH